jgi:hypothetical protein
MTETKNSAPLLSRVKSWQLIGLGVTGWCTFYSIALLTWGSSSALIGNLQGGCFAATMTLASLETRRYRRPVQNNSLQWIQGLPTEHLNRTLAEILVKQEYYVEPSRPEEKEMGFGVRAVKAGRTMVFETARWHEPIINLPHAKATEENRQKVFADIAYIVSLGAPDAEARAFAQNHPIRFLARRELMAKLAEAQAQAAANATRTA